jgi:hypothetical protein
MRKDNLIEPTDQSIFGESQPILQAPPEEIARQEYIKENKVILRKKRSKMLMLFLGIVMVFSSLLALIVYQPAQQPPPPPAPTPTLIPQNPTALQQELERLGAIVDEADPNQKPLIPPPVDMDVRL